MKNYLRDAIRKVKNIEKRNLSIYDKIEIGDHELWLTSQELSAILNEKLIKFLRSSTMTKNLN